MRVLVTGASGFIGRNILRAVVFKLGELMLWGADATDRALLGKYSDNVIIGRLQDLDRFKKAIVRFAPQVCVHLAWQGIPDYSFEMSKENLDNSVGFINFLANNTSCKKIIISGSCMEYGKSSGICGETDTPGSNSFFSWAKNSLYSYCKFVCNDAKIDLIWLRLFYVYGLDQKPRSLVPSIVKALRSGRVPDIKKPFNSNDFVNCADVANAFGIAIKRKVVSGIYNVGTGKSTKVITVCRMVEKELTGRTCISDRISGNAVLVKASGFRADIKKTGKLLGWYPQISLRAGIEQYINNPEA